jgi:multidrug efflux pump subunit AcrA (membrane-fusion protein)
MDETPVQYSIDGNDPAPAKRHTDTDAAAEMEKTRRALTEANAARNELLQARRERAAFSLEAVDAEVERASQAFERAWENGDPAQIAASQREIAAIEIKRNNARAVAERLDRTQPLPLDPVEAFAAGRSTQAQDWLRSHPEYVINERKNAKLSAAHSNAIAEGITPDTPQYFSHVNQFLGIDGGGAGRRRSSDSGGEIRRVIVTDNPNKQLGPGEVRMTRGEHRAATETLTWNYDSPDGKHKRGSPLGVEEYLRRKSLMKQQGGYYDKLD